MIDRVVIISAVEALVVYHDRKPLRLHSDYNIQDFVCWFLDNRKTNEYDEHRKAVKAGIEDTQEIKVG